MKFSDFEKYFTRAVAHSYSKKKILFTIPFLFLCGVIVVVSRTIAYAANKWIAFGIIFLSILSSFAVLYVLGVFLVKIYYHEVKKQQLSYTEIIKRSFKTAIETFRISLSVIISFCLLWLIFGFFSALKEIPQIGSFIGILISIIPYVIILSSIFICIFNFLALFFAVPAVTLKNYKKWNFIKEIIKNFKENIFINLIFFLSCFFIIFLMSFALILAAVLTKYCFPIPINNLYLGLQWFFIMIPFIVFLSPLVIFFFNFACEAYNFLQKRES